MHSQDWGRLYIEDNGSYYIAGLVVNYGISNTFVLEIPQFTAKQAILSACKAGDTDSDWRYLSSEIPSWRYNGGLTVLLL